MKSDTAIQEFLEKYDEDALGSIDSLSKRFGPKVHKTKIQLLNLQECFNTFESYLKGYAKYKVDNVSNKDASPQDAIIERTNKFIESTMNNKEMDVLYSEIPNFVKSYTEGIKSLNSSIDEIKHYMETHDVNSSDIGAINDFADKFVTVVTEAYDQMMDKLLWSSGYHSNKILFEGKQDPRTKDSHVFL